jgi:hypothetical protein
VKLLLVAAAALAAASCGQRVGSVGVTVVLPPGWHELDAGPPSLAGSADPVTRIVVASGPIRFGRGCNDVDYAFPPTAVAIVVLEWTRPTPWAPKWPPRPRRFTPTTLRVRPPPAIECFAGPGGSAQFADHGRRFDAFLLLGRRAPVALAARARSVLDTLKVSPR